MVTFGCTADSEDSPRINTDLRDRFIFFAEADSKHRWYI